jgi:YARHG domain-containing protein
MKPYLHLRSGLFLLLFAIGASCVSVQAQDGIERWEKFDFANSALKSNDIAAVPLDELKLMRGIIFGRHGRMFKDADIKNYLDNQGWFKANADFTNAQLNDTERRNLDLIRIAEASKHETVQPGDMRYWNTRVLTTKKLGQHSGAEWLVLKSEIEAIHGKRFDDEPWLQRYFDERYWYAASADFSPKQLNATEQKNLATIAAAQKRSRNVAMAPGDMELFENRAISAC